jgi:hypothetical protein
VFICLYTLFYNFNSYCIISRELLLSEGSLFGPLVIKGFVLLDVMILVDE